MKVDGKWAGTIWGTNNGTAIAVIQETSEGKIAGRYLIIEAGVGKTQAELTGTLGRDGSIEAVLRGFKSPSDLILPEKGEMAGHFDSDKGVIEGEWSTDLGSAGRFVLLPSPTESDAAGIIPEAAPPAGDGGKKPPALITKTRILGSYRLGQDDVRRLAELVAGGTKVPEPAFNATSDGRSFIHIGFEGLLSDPSVPAIVYELLISANEPVTNVGTKTVTVTFKPNEPNTLFVSDYDRTWVEGKAAEIEIFLQKRESRVAKFLKKYGPNVNSLIFLAMLVFLPSVESILERSYIVLATFALLLSLFYSWNLAVNSKVFLRETKLAWYKKHENLWVTGLNVVLTGFIAWLIATYVQ